jgi:hypothetical protein
MRLGTMTFGERAGKIDVHEFWSHTVEYSIPLWDNTERYAAPARRQTDGATEAIIGYWPVQQRGMRRCIMLAKSCWPGCTVCSGLARVGARCGRHRGFLRTAQPRVLRY